MNNHTSAMHYAISPLRKQSLNSLFIILFRVILFLMFLSVSLNTKAEDKKGIPGSQPLSAGLSKIYTSLFSRTPNGELSLADGVANTYYPTYCNLVDEADAIKFLSFNTKESVSILRDGKKLAIEKRVPIVDRDSIFLDMGELMDKNYVLNFIPQNFNTELSAYLEDDYLGTLVPISLSDSTNYTFTTSSAQPDSKSANRFTVIFTLPGLLPVNFSGLKAFEQNAAVNVEWKVENEINVNQYLIDRSKDGIHFTTIGSRSALASHEFSTTYSYNDAFAETGINYYRITNVNRNGSKTYSKIIKITLGDKRSSSINVYPTVITDGTVTMQFNNTPKGVYTLRLVNANGQIMFAKAINHQAGSSTEYIKIDKNTSKGICQLSIAGPDQNIFPTVKLINR